MKTGCCVVCVCRQHSGLTELNGRLVESLQLYHSLMQELPSYSQPAVHNMPTYMSLSQVQSSYTTDSFCSSDHFLILTYTRFSWSATIECLRIIMYQVHAGWMDAVVVSSRAGI